MNLRSLLLTCSLLLFIESNSKAQVSFISGNNGTITVSTSGSGKGVNAAVANAEKNVLYTLLFRGIPGSEQNTAFINIQEDEARQKYGAYINELFDSRYATFITSATQEGDVIKEKHHQADVLLKVTVNVAAFRKDLENNGIIRKFGF